MKSFKQYINGKTIEGKGKTIEVIRPADGTVCGEFKNLDKDQALMALEAADQAFKSWSKLSVAARVTWMEN
jgi:acyl-CoA reductase-like NAD-dependent aldehyde dehydrogenase